MLPYYRYLVIWSGLYTVHGGFIDWTNDDLGILSFSNELWNSGQYFNSPALKDDQRRPDSPITPQQYEQLKEVIQPQSDEQKWASIPWLTNLWQARQRAAAEGKPILLWEMDGHPLGCT